MQANIHPKYQTTTFTCSCGNKIETRSTLCKDYRIEVCSNCHPFYAGTQKILDAGGRIERFNKRFGRLSGKKN